MKTPYKNIYEVLKINRFIVLITVAGATISGIFFGWMVYDINRTALNNSFAINTDGSVIPLKWVSQQENLQVEALAHLELFHSWFYNIDASNYQRNLEKALWLGNSSVDNLYRQKKADGLYNRLLQYSLVQRVVSIESEVDIQQEPYDFRTRTVFEVNRGKVVDRYELISSGNLIKVDRHFPNNSHGLLITNYFENSLKKLNNEN
ncbi:conjugal transfer protein TraK [Antarcticibacterium flavum]|uniref:Conjugal transfer protein TraK n=1 Tax=Antarcticibacterium flavum TaxID=2058175 RepID=A0A5B7X6F3_9FLAO|nr:MULTISPECIES: conjugal transfer protein TraK [Antarcticibacterium]MCM4160869.1 conjugal transfer protein TraK [Antarcticibacterium sp. W02-3]QCY71094.1 conjugal transfer protein TraK [Antarcticibacterium flavum]